MKVNYEHGKVKLEGLNGTETVFYNKILDFFKQRIGHQYPLDTSPQDPMQVQRAAHEAFVDSRSQCVYGRGTQLKQVEDYYMSDTSHSPLLIVGLSGGGKSSLLAKCTKDA